jgi:DNA modification methylase
MKSQDYRDRSYLSAIEAAKILGITVRSLHEMAKSGRLPCIRAASGQMRFDFRDLKKCAEGNDLCHESARTTAEKEGIRKKSITVPVGKEHARICRLQTVHINNTFQNIITGDSGSMRELKDGSVHLMVTSPPYFDTKMYSRTPIRNDLGNVHDVDAWFRQIEKVWKEVYRVLQPGRKAFINIMNLPIRDSKGGFRTLNLAGRTIDLCEDIGFIFKRDIVWHKTNAVRAHFGTYPYPGGILINNMHEFILEFDKPAPRGYGKYAHLSDIQKELSRIDKEFWLSIKKSDVWVMKPQGSGDRRRHVAPFPLELPVRLIKAFSYVSETVLDPFAGSGTTLLAAAGLGRNGVGYEINPEIACESYRTLAEMGEAGESRQGI